MRKSTRRTKKTRLVFGEGPTERVFLAHIRDTYYSKEFPITVKVASGTGGSPLDVLRAAVNHLGGAEYDETFIVLDTDVDWDEAVQRFAHDRHLTMIGNTPCIESLFLEILLPDLKGKWRQNCVEAKKKFERECMKKRTFDIRCCQKIFIPDVLEESRLRIPVLDRIIRLFAD